MLARLRAAARAFLSVATVEIATFGPNDTIVISVPGLLSADGRRHIKEDCQMVWPGVRVVVLDCGMMLKVVRDTLPDPSDPGVA